MTLLSKYMLNARNDVNRKALIQLSSLSGIRWCFGNGIYGGTKGFNRVLAKLIDQSNRGNPWNKVDSMVVAPGMVTTAMINYAKNSYSTCSTDELVQGCLRDVGFSFLTHGSRVHTLWGC